MTAGRHAQPALCEHREQARGYLAAIAARLTACGIDARLHDDGDGIPVLSASDRRDEGVISLCTDSGTAIHAIWSPPPGTTPQATADTIIAVVGVIWPSMRPGTGQ